MWIKSSPLEIGSLGNAGIIRLKGSVSGQVEIAVSSTGGLMRIGGSGAPRELLDVRANSVFYATSGAGKEGLNVVSTGTGAFAEGIQLHDAAVGAAIGVGTFKGAFRLRRSNLNTILQIYNGSDIVFLEASNTNGNVFLVQSTGRVAIGTTNPTTDGILDVRGNQVVFADSVAYATGLNVFNNGINFAGFAIHNGASGTSISTNTQKAFYKIRNTNFNTVIGVHNAGGGGTDIFSIELDNADGHITFGAEVDFNSHKGVNLTDPTAAQDAATKNYVDTTTVKVAVAQVGFAALNAAGSGVALDVGSALPDNAIVMRVWYDVLTAFHDNGTGGDTDTSVIASGIVAPDNIVGNLPLTNGDLTAGYHPQNPVNIKLNAATHATVTWTQGTGDATLLTAGQLAVYVEYVLGF